MIRVISKMRKYNNKIILIIGFACILSLIFAIPFLSGFIKVGADTTFHLNRIEALSIAIENGDYFPRVFLEQNYGYGYGSPMFYSIVYLYPAALMRLLGMSLPDVYRVYSIMLVFFASLSIMIVTDKIVKPDKLSVIYIVGALYMLNNFALNRIFKRGAIGEMLGMIFVPIVIYAIVQIIYKNKHNWMLLGLSFSLLFLAHNISFILMALLFFVLIIINIKDIIINKKILTIVKGTVLGILLSAFYIAPMLEQLRNNIYFINFSFGQENVYLQGGTFLDLLSSAGNDDVFLTAGIGASLFILPLISLVKNKDSRVYGIVGFFLLYMTTKYFPWHYITFLNVIQFPSRTLVIAIPILCIASGYCLNDWFKQEIYLKITVVISLALSLISFANTSYELLFETWGAIRDDTTSEMIKTGKDLYLEQDIHFWYNIPEVSSPEYLPVYLYHYYDNSHYPKLYTQENSYDLAHYSYNEMTFVVNLDHNNLKTVFPKTYYRGYYVDIYENGEYQESLKTRVDDEGRFVMTEIPEEYADRDITLILVYKGTIAQKLSLMLSFLTAFVMIAYKIYLNRRIKNA